MTTATSSSSTCTLDIGGMTCASCVRHVEKALSRIDGVDSAEVNLATEAATVSFDPQAAGLSELTAAVAAAGYIATPRHAATPATPPAPSRRRATTRTRRPRPTPRMTRSCETSSASGRSP